MIFLIVSLIIDRDHLFPDNWLYIHSPEFRVGRIQNFKNWSTEMVPDSSKNLPGNGIFLQRRGRPLGNVQRAVN